MEREDVRVLDVGGDLDLVKEPLGAEHGGEVRSEHLNGELAVVLQVVGQIDRRHPAPPELALERVTVTESLAERLRNIGQEVPAW